MQVFHATTGEFLSNVVLARSHEHLMVGGAEEGGEEEEEKKGKKKKKGKRGGKSSLLSMAELRVASLLSSHAVSV